MNCELANQERQEDLSLQPLPDQQNTKNRTKNTKNTTVAHFNEQNPGFMLAIDILEAEKTNLRITPPQRKKTAKQRDLEETCDTLLRRKLSRQKL